MALLCFGVWLVMLMVSHYVSLASMVAGCCFPVFTLISPKVNGSTAFVVFSFVIAILLIYTHRKNIERLKAGTESKTFIWKPRRVKLDDEERKRAAKSTIGNNRLRTFRRNYPHKRINPAAGIRQNKFLRYLCAAIKT